eukprot:UN19230
MQLLHSNARSLIFRPHSSFLLIFHSTIRVFFSCFLCQLDFITFDTLWRSGVNPFS